MSEKDVGREPIEVVQIDQDFCSLTYGTAPCTAAVGTTGSRKCFNTRATCQDPDNYDRGTLTLTFSRPRPLGLDEYVIPSLRGVDTQPTVLNVGAVDEDKGPIGTRESVTAEFEDHPHTDRKVDKYLDDRTYYPLEQGTFWTKWLIRNPYYQNRKMRVYRGYYGQTLSQMKSRTYFIDEVSGPDSAGKVRVKAKDILKLADNDRAQAPRQSEGVLVNDIGSGDGSFEVRGDINKYDNAGFLKIGDEVIEYSGTTDNGSTFTVSVVTDGRGVKSTEAESHSADDTVQSCLQITNSPVWEVVRDLLQDNANIDPAFINYTEWQNEGQEWLTQFNQLSTLITEPTGVNELLGELTEQCLFFLWWDSEKQLIEFRAIRPEGSGVKSVNDDANTIADSAVQRQKAEQRLSQIWIYYDRRNPVEDLDSEQNFNKVRVLVDSEAESANQYGEKRVKKIYSRWLETEGQAIFTSNRLLNAYRDNPRYVKLRLDAKDRSLWTADPVDVTHRRIVDDTGAPQTERWIVIKAEEVEPGEVVEYDLQTAQIFGTVGRWMVDTAPDYFNASPAEKSSGAWWADANGNVGSSNNEAYDWV